MDCYDDYFIEILSFIDEYKELINCHLVDFITDNLWEKCLPINLRNQLENLEKINFNLTTFTHTNEDCSELRSFIDKINYLNLKNNPYLLKLEDLSILSNNQLNWMEFFNNNNNNENKIKQNFMKEKKYYEIQVLTKVIGYLSKINSSLVIDVGAGKGYLGTSLYENYKIPVLSIDSCESRHKSAINRQKLLLKKTHKSYPLVQHSINYIDESTDYSELVKESLPDYKDKENYLIAGLHTCGSLAGAMIKGFLNSHSLKTLVVVSCCYHLTEQCLTESCKFTKNARMLAQQSIERIANKSESSPSLFYRSLLEILFKSLGISNSKIGRGAPTKDFATYATWALEKVGSELDKIPSTDELNKLYETYADKKWKFDAFQYLRIQLSSLIESALVLDRVLYLQKSGKCSKVSVVRLFDPVTSPRCYAIIALK